LDTIPVLLDTDIGSDIDDAVALAYLLRQPRCELLGITTVTGEPERRASLADAVCRASGRADGPPIHVGVEAPLLGAQRQGKAPQTEALTQEWPHRLFGHENTAIRFLQETIRSRPGEITLLTIGPLTNIALLFALDPEIPMLLKQMVIMGGRFLAPKADTQAEWNILCDPAAAAKVFQTPLPALTAVGLDVTEPCRMAADECRNRFEQAGGPLGPVAAMAEVWFRHASAITFHDPLAAALIFEPTLCRIEETAVEVDLCEVPGRTRQLTPPEPRPHRICVGVDPSAFFSHYFEVVGG
jgi:purine nucleosidase